MKTRINISILLILIISAFMPASIAGISYTVSVNGNDQNFGTPESPFRTIQHCANVATAGATCTVLPGSYISEGRISVGKPINLVCANSRMCKIQAASITSGSVIDGFYSIDNPSNDGALVGSGSGYVIKNNKVEGSCMVGIKLNGSNGLADGNEVFRSKQCSGSSGPDADGFRFFGSNHILRNNYIHDIHFSDSHVGTTPHIDCFQTWGGASNVTIENNTCDNYDAVVGENNGSQGSNLENCNGCNFNGNYFHVYGKGILWESSSSNGTATDNIFVSGPDISGTLGGKYCLFGSAKVTGNICYLYKAGDVLVGGASGTGNVTTDPKMNGYCSLAFPTKGVPCGNSITPVPVTPTITKTPTVSPTATKTITPTATASRVPSGTNTATATATRTATVSATSTFTPSDTPSPSATAPTYTLTLVINTVTPTSTLTRVPVMPSPTPAPINKCDFNHDGRVTWFEGWLCKWIQ